MIAIDFEFLPDAIRHALCEMTRGHQPYTHVHDDEPTVTYCVRCRKTLKETP